jgi:hypothetical protein
MIESFTSPMRITMDMNDMGLRAASKQMRVWRNSMRLLNGRLRTQFMLGKTIRVSQSIIDYDLQYSPQIDRASQWRRDQSRVSPGNDKQCFHD